MKNLKALIIVWSLLAAVASAAAVWDTKPFTEWSDKDMEKLLTDSPWAGKASLTHEREGANLGPVPDWHVIVSVRSAEPIRRAVARQLLAGGLPASPDLEANLAAPYPRYALAFAKIPQFYRTQLQKSAQGTVLRVKGQNLNAVNGSVQLLDKDGKAGVGGGRPDRASGTGRIRRWWLWRGRWIQGRRNNRNHAPRVSEG
jgi:hypothetical protein